MVLSHILHLLSFAATLLSSHVIEFGYNTLLTPYVLCVLQSEIERLREEISQDTEATSQAVQNSKIQQLELTIQNLQVCAPVHNTVCGSAAYALMHVWKEAICALLYVFKVH